MSNMFSNYDNIDPNYIPDNRHPFGFFDSTDDLIIGGTAHHVFKLDFKYSEVCEQFELTYRQSLSKVLVKGVNSIGVNITEFDDFSVIDVELLPEETVLFKPFRETAAQIKFWLVDGTVIFGEAHKINIINTVENTDYEKEGGGGDMSDITSVVLEGTKLAFKDEDNNTKMSVNLNPLVANVVTAATLNGTEVSFKNKNGVTEFCLDLQTIVDMAAAGKQDKLVSGQNIKTINGQSILGAGNIQVAADLEDYYTKEETDAKVADKVDKVAGKSLIADIEISRLANVDNYDDAEIKASIDDLSDDIDSLEEKTSVNYAAESAKSLDSFKKSGFYYVENAVGNPAGTSNKGSLKVTEFDNSEKIFQEWFSETGFASRIYEAAPENTFKVDGVRKNPVNGIVELQAGKTYELTGHLNGSVKISATTKAHTKLILNGVSINSTGEAGIGCYKTGAGDTELKSPLTIELKEGSKNYITVEDMGTVTDYGAVYSAGDLVIVGTGYLAAKANVGHGIKGSDITISGLPHIYVDANHDGIHASGKLYITNGVFHIANANDAFSSGNDANTGMLRVSGGVITVEHCKQDAFQSRNQGVIAIYGDTKLVIADGFNEDGYVLNAELVADIYETVDITEMTATNVLRSGAFAKSDLPGKNLPAKVAVLNDTGMAIDHYIEPTGNTFVLNVSQATYVLSGNFSDYVIKCSIKKPKVRLNNIYCSTNSLGDFITYDYKENNYGKGAIEFNLDANTINYIKKTNGCCINSIKHIGINKTAEYGDIYLESANGTALQAGGEVRLVNDGGRYIRNSNIGVLCGALYLGDEFDPTKSGKPDYTKNKKTSNYIYNNVNDVVLQKWDDAGTAQSAKLFMAANDTITTIIDKVTINKSELAASISAKSGELDFDSGAYKFNNTACMYIKTINAIDGTQVDMENVRQYADMNTILVKSDYDKAFPSGGMSAWNVHGSPAEVTKAMYDSLEARVAALEGDEPSAEPEFNGTELDLSNVTLAEELNLTDVGELNGTELIIK